MTAGEATDLAEPTGRRAAAPSGLVLGVGLVLAAVNLRTAVAAVPPLLSRIQDDLGLSGVAAGSLTTLPVVCMGLFAPVAQRLAARVGREATVGWALLVIAAGTLVRLGGGSLVLLFGGTLLAGVGIAVGQTVLPGVVKEHFAGRDGALTALYSTAMAVGATVAAAVAVPVETASGSWQRSLAVWCAPALLALAVWWPLTGRLRRAHATRRREPDPQVVAAGTAALPWRSTTAWLISLYLGVQSLLFYSQLSWIPPLYEQRGWSASRAGLALSVFNLVGIAGSLALPSVAGRRHDRRPMFYLSMGASVLGLTMVALAPTTLPWLWLVVMGVGQGGAFSLGLLLLVDHADDPATSSRLSAMAFLVAYSLAAVGPAALGALRDATGTFTAAFLVLAGLGMVELALATAFSPARRQRGVRAAA
ncbi:MAG: MFS transporter [Frankiaceae bacterium]